eukprot:gnl/TRDRNA2_/TRDRNA2_60948_c0_seq1.p1 gnl/TRDRNA2_/TRDRNA2_60948_c0~~gnl/TRDRNA2_/TRDRNA2_60948_c0_seq1.p1  ORF type:complete len:149 (-),score=28.28 gnl/TRDRNA2_/TRDRNA2_60948_c0_seq1:53-499(-)
MAQAAGLVQVVHEGGKFIKCTNVHPRANVLIKVVPCYPMKGNPNTFGSGFQYDEYLKTLSPGEVDKVGNMWHDGMSTWMATELSPMNLSEFKVYAWPASDGGIFGCCGPQGGRDISECWKITVTDRLGELNVKKIKDFGPQTPSSGGA